MIVVSNTSPLTSLAAIGQFDLLGSLFGRVQVASAVIDELNAFGQKWPGAVEADTSQWITAHEATESRVIDVLRLDLDRGEAETIALALQLQADLVLLDEQAGRLAAQHLGLRTMGVVGVLVRARQRGLLQEIRPSLDALRQQAGFYLSQAVYDHALRLADEAD